MIKHFSFFANWRKTDVDFLNNLSLDRKIEQGYFGFKIEEGDTYERIMEHFSKKDSIFSKTKPKEFSCTFTTVSFSKSELEKSKYYELKSTGESKGFPLPENSFEEEIFKIACSNCKSGIEQKASFHIKEVKWKKNQANFTLRDPDFMFFRKRFFQEILHPLGLESREVIIHKTGKVSDDIVQLEIPFSKSKLIIDGSSYDNGVFCEKCGVKQYSIQTLDFFPPFEKELNFYICKTQEEFIGGRRRIIISKEFCELLVKHKIIKFNSWSLTPMKI
ncbi:MAG: hypothetical protein V3V33_05665 [Candidatus Lokiarchaeia archaeon]